MAEARPRHSRGTEEAQRIGRVHGEGTGLAWQRHRGVAAVWRRHGRGTAEAQRKHTRHGRGTAEAQQRHSRGTAEAQQKSLQNTGRLA